MENDSSSRTSGSVLEHEQLRQKVADYEWLDRCTAPMVSADDVFSLMAVVRALFEERFSLHRFGIMIGTVNEKYCVIHEIVTRTDMEACPPGSLMVIQSTGLERVYQTRAAHYNPDILQNPEFVEDEELSSTGIRSIARIPLVAKGAVFGVMTVKSVHPGAYAESDLELMAAVANRLSGCLYNIKLMYQLKQQAYQDALTGVFNRRFCMDAFGTPGGLDLVHELTQVEWSETNRVSVLFLDINHFKNLNDYAGHVTADNILSETANAIVDVVGQRGFVVRYGGDEFLVVLPGMEEAEAQEMVTRLHLRAAHFNEHRPEPRWELAFSVGLATGNADAFNGLVHQADEHMYATKKQQRAGSQMEA